MPPGVDAAIRAATGQGGRPGGITPVGILPGLPAGSGIGAGEAQGQIGPSTPPPGQIPELGPAPPPSDQEVDQFRTWARNRIWHNEARVIEEERQQIRGGFITFIAVPLAGVAVGSTYGPAAGAVWSVSEASGEGAGNWMTGSDPGGRDLDESVGDAAFADVAGQLTDEAIKATTGLDVPGPGAAVTYGIQQAQIREQNRGPAPPAASNQDMQAMMFSGQGPGGPSQPASPSPAGQ
jgi:hypothetical protein